MASHDVISIINDSPLSDEKKAAFTKVISDNGLTPEVLEALKDMLRGAQLESLESMGLMPNASDIAQVEQEFQAEVGAAAEEFADAMADVQKQVDATMKTVVKETEKAHAKLTAAAITE